MVPMFFYRKFDVNMLSKFKKFNESCSLSKAARMSATCFKQNLGLLLAKTGAKGEPMATPPI